MNLPNMLTVSRLVAAPVFYLLWKMPSWTGLPALPFLVAALILFIYIEITDILDGWIARKQGLVTDLGKLLDPFSDVLSRLTYFVAFMDSGIMPSWIFLPILYRELGMSFIRTILYHRGIALAARTSGKLKAVFYAISGGAGILVAFLALFPVPAAITSAASWTALGFFAVSALLAWLSFADYIKVFLKILREGESPKA